MQDGNALIHRMTDSSTAPATFGEIALRLLDMMVTCKALIFSTDCYSICYIKAQERIRRGISQKYLVFGPARKKPTDFKLFLRNENKQFSFRNLFVLNSIN